VYHIKDLRDLESHPLNLDLECIFTAGKVPSAIPLGIYHSRNLQVLDTRRLNSLMDLTITEKYVTQVPCRVEQQGNVRIFQISSHSLVLARIVTTNESGFIPYEISSCWHSKFWILGTRNTSAFILWNNFGRSGTPGIPAGVQLGNVKDLMSNLEEGEFYDGRDSLVVDCSDDIAARCPAYVTPDVQRNLVVQKTETGNLYPLSELFDLIRLVGVQEKDGARIYLGKSYVRSAFDTKAGVVSFFSFKNYDLRVNPSFQIGDKLEPLVSVCMPMDNSFPHK